MAGNEGPLDLLRLEHVRRRRPRSRRSSRCREVLRGAGVARQVDRDHAMAEHEGGQQLDPVLRRSGQPVQEQQRLADAAGIVVAKPRPSARGSRFVAPSSAEYPQIVMAISGRRAR